MVIPAGLIAGVCQERVAIWHEIGPGLAAQSIIITCHWPVHAATSSLLSVASRRSPCLLPACAYSSAVICSRTAQEQMLRGTPGRR
jgi:hypothetical protein